MLWSLKDIDSSAPSFPALGVRVDLVEFDAGKVAFGNSDIRISGLTEPISRVPFFFARSNLFCQVGGGALRQLGNVADAIDLPPTGVQPSAVWITQVVVAPGPSSSKAPATDPPSSPCCSRTVRTRTEPVRLEQPFLTTRRVSLHSVSRLTNIS